ncbi:MAG: LPXTG cell wall anchor domain-containing protein [Oscillospiraceae bacterium]|nr:LPXTG cell wall anchor domain-containing protein [Oscillospiraceae bacterium]
MNPATGVDFVGAIIAAAVALVVLIGLFVLGKIKKK